MIGQSCITTEDKKVSDQFLAKFAGIISDLNLVWSGICGDEEVAKKDKTL